MEYQRVTKAAQKGQSQTPSSSLRQTSLNHVAVHPLLELQRTIGNQAVLNLLRAQNTHIDASTQAFREPRFGHDFSRIPIHPSQTVMPQMKLKVSQPGDMYEQEADQVAEQVMCMTDVESPVSDDEDETKKSLMRKQSTEPQADASTDSSNVSPVVHAVLNSGGGQPLDTTTRAFMEPRFGHDFSQVCVHTDERAAGSARSVNAMAYTVGRDVVFGERQYAPGTSAGRRLLAHELAHVVQQNTTPQNSSLRFSPHQSDNQLEHEGISIAQILSEQSVADSKDSLSSIPKISMAASLHLVRKKKDTGTEVSSQKKDTSPDPVVTRELKETVLIDDDYIDNHLKSMDFFGDAATLHFENGARLTIGLVSQQIRPPIETVDYHSAKSEYAEVILSPSMQYKFIRKFREQGRGRTFSEVIKSSAQTLIFNVDQASGKIVPNHINPLTAPQLCAFLLYAEGQYLKNTDEISKGAVKVFKKQRWILRLALGRAVLEAVGPAIIEAVAERTTSAIANRLVLATARIVGNSAKMMQAARLLAAMKFLSALQKAQVILEFFQRIGFATNKEGLIDEGESYLMYSEDGRFGFRFIKATGQILHGVIDLATGKYNWKSFE